MCAGSARGPVRCGSYTVTYTGFLNCWASKAAAGRKSRFADHSGEPKFPVAIIGWHRRCLAYQWPFGGARGEEKSRFGGTFVAGAQFRGA